MLGSFYSMNKMPRKFPGLLNTGAPCPTKVREVLASILHWGLLDIRGAALEGDSERCHRQADHLHNLPALLNNYSPELLDFYWNVSRRGFIEQTPPEQLKTFQKLWDELAPFVKLVPKPELSLAA